MRHSLMLRHTVALEARWPSTLGDLLAAGTCFAVWAFTRVDSRGCVNAPTVKESCTEGTIQRADATSCASHLTCPCSVATITRPLHPALPNHPCPQVEAFPLAGMFGLCVAFMVVSMVSQVQLQRLSQGKGAYHKVAASEEGGPSGNKPSAAEAT